ncbi:hypothetical protein C8R47DRAFT_472448 [Mycena vitilis]|nr:hypothetical protein C8R47DRAFT_472448 [Mycena vitilis]
MEEYSDFFQSCILLARQETEGSPVSRAPFASGATLMGNNGKANSPQPSLPKSLEPSVAFADGGSSDFLQSCVLLARRETEGSLLPLYTGGAPSIREVDAKGVENSPQLYLPESAEPSEVYAGASTDFFGLHPNPRCVYRIGPEWVHVQPDDARPIASRSSKHWTRSAYFGYIDPVRFAENGGEPGPPHLWIGVIPGSLSVEAAKAAAARCQNVLAEADFPDVEIAFRESIYSRSAGGGGRRR